MAAGVENYGLCIASASLTQTVGGPFVRVSPFNNTCAADKQRNQHYRRRYIKRSAKYPEHH